MCRVKAKIVRGSIKSECIAYIKTSSGVFAEIVLNCALTGSNHIVAAEITRNKNNVLIELPQETSSGDWRVWVDKKLVTQPKT
jgi:hypothetical protein